MHHEHSAVVISEALDGIESLGVNGRFVGVAVVVGVLDEANFIAADDFGPQAGHVVCRHQ